MNNFFPNVILLLDNFLTLKLIIKPANEKN